MNKANVMIRVVSVGTDSYYEEIFCNTRSYEFVNCCIEKDMPFPPELELKLCEMVSTQDKITKGRCQVFLTWSDYLPPVWDENGHLISGAFDLNFADITLNLKNVEVLRMYRENAIDEKEMHEMDIELNRVLMVNRILDDRDKDTELAKKDRESLEKFLALESRYPDLNEDEKETYLDILDNLYAPTLTGGILYELESKAYKQKTEEYYKTTSNTKHIQR